MYIVVELNTKMMEKEPNSPEKTNAVKYLKKVESNRRKFLEQLNTQLNN